MSDSFSIDGLDEVVTAFETAAKQIQPELRKTVYRGAMNVKRAAVAGAPSDRKVPGIRRINVDIATGGARGRSSRSSVVGGDEVRADVEALSPLASIIEFGAPTLPGGRPFMGPALETEREPLPRAVDAVVAKLLS